jgi:SAM-dependent methyltransferase
MRQAELLPAGAAFDAIAESFDARFDPWLSVAKQRAAVREELLGAFAEGARLLEVGGGTGTDAAWMVAHGRSVFLTDTAPMMVERATCKIGREKAAVVAAEDLGLLAEQGQRFDGVYSNFAALNCVADLVPVGQALARLVRPGGSAVLVVFGCSCPNEMLVEAVRGRFGSCLRRFRRGEVPASLGGRTFTVRYHRRDDLVRALAPAFRLRSRKGIGVAVPPSAAEPWISRHPRLLDWLASVDRAVAKSLAPLGDHVLYRFERTESEPAA